MGMFYLIDFPIIVYAPKAMKLAKNTSFMELLQIAYSPNNTSLFLKVALRGLP